jgi:hypothetical protein
VGQAQNEVWRDGRLANCAANAVGAKVLSAHLKNSWAMPLLVIIYSRE